MDLELRISQYIDGELSGEEEAELHHMLAVSPEARALFRQHLTIHTVARDERVLHRPEQSMRDNLFARLQAEEGMKPSAVTLASAGAEAVTLAAADFPSERRIAQDRPPIASEADSRTEERRRRRRLIPILIPLLLCVIVGGVWYGGGFGGNGGSGGEQIAENQGAKQQPSATSDRDYTEQTEASITNPAYDSLTQPRTSVSSSSVHLADALRPEDRSASSESHRNSFGSAPEPAPEMYALRSVPADEVNDVLGIASTDIAVADDADDMELGNETFDLAQADGNVDLSASAPDFAMQPLAYETSEEKNLWDRQADFTPPLQDSMAITLVPEPTITSAVFSPNRDQSVVIGGGAGNIRTDGIDVSDRFSVPSAMSNSIPLSNTVVKPVLGGRLYDTATGRPVIPTIDNYEQFAAMLEAQGLQRFQTNSEMNEGLQNIAVNDGVVNVNTGSRSMNGTFDVNAFVPLSTDESAREKGEGAVPVVMSSTFSSTSSSPLTALGGNSDSLNIAVVETSQGQGRENQVNKSLPAVGGGQAMASVSADEYVDVEDASLEPSHPRGVNFFIGLDQSLGASVNSMEVALPLPASSFSSFTDNGISPETRIMFGIDFDGGRQKVFVTAGAWGYDRRESIRSREITHVTTGNSVVNTVTTTVSEKEEMVYEVWGGAGYRYSINVSQKLDAGAEVWGGVGGEYLHAGLSVPLSYQLVENLQLEVSPGLLYRSLHATAEQVTTGVPASDSYEERIITPKDEHRLEAAVRIGLILLLR